MAYYYFQTIGGRQSCIKIHSSFPLPPDVNANCGNDLPHPDGLHYVGTATVACNTGGSVSTDVYTDQTAAISKLAKLATAKKAAPKKKPAKKKAAPRKKKAPRKKAAPKKKKAAPKKKTVPKKKAAPKKKKAARPSKKSKK